jgi:hypothetical protein
VLRLSEDERRYIHSLVHGGIIQTSPLDADVSANDLLEQVVALFEESPYPVYAANQYGDLVAWNRAVCDWYDDWGALEPAERNIVRWMLLSPVARARLVDWEDDTRDAVGRWRAESGRHSADRVLQSRIAELTRISPEFRAWWSQHHVMEHRTKIRRFRHDRLGLQVMRIVPLGSPETVPAGVVLHIPLRSE